MITRKLWNKSTMVFGGAACWGLLLIGCVAVNRTAVAPPHVAGAEFVGSKTCAECHDEVTSKFHNATHAKLIASGANGQEIGCESCHGPGSLHAESGGGVGTIVNPGKNPDVCFQCHLDKRADFSLPNSHPLMAGHITCSDCHDVHEGNAIKGSGAAMESMNETCIKCHTAQKGPFVYEHGAMKEGCTACHSPHGSVNAKMLVARDANLCLQCHLEAPGAAGVGQINANAINPSVENHNSRLMAGTCWTAGCHEAVHGSNANLHLRR